MAADKSLLREKILKVYALYPKKMGKSAGLTKATLQCKTLEDVSLLEQAVKRYRDHLVQESTEAQYILYFSTFMNQWRDWLEPETGSVAGVRVDLKGLGFDDD